MNSVVWTWAPAVVLLLGAALSVGGEQQQRSMSLRAPLETAVPATLEGYQARDVVISEEEQKVAGMSDYVMRVFTPAAAALAPISVYVGYYDRQAQGKTIHSPRNCLPGAGWEPLTMKRGEIQTALGAVPVNQYVIQNGDQRALVLYWYQGRGRVAANEYLVKWNLLRDQALRGRSDEALVRVIVPMTGSEQEATRRAHQIAETLVPSVARALPV